MREFRIAIVDAPPMPGFTERIHAVLTEELPPILKVSQPFDLVAATHTIRQLRIYGIAADLVADSAAMVEWSSQSERLLLVQNLCPCEACKQLVPATSVKIQLPAMPAAIAVMKPGVPASPEKSPIAYTGKLQTGIPAFFSFFHACLAKLLHLAVIKKPAAKSRSEEQCRGK